MEQSIPTKNKYSDPRKKLAELIRTKVPDYEEAATSAEAVDRDRLLVSSGNLTENELLGFYAEAYGLERTDEEEISTPDPYPGGKLTSSTPTFAFRLNGTMKKSFSWFPILIGSTS